MIRADDRASATTTTKRSSTMSAVAETRNSYNNNKGNANSNHETTNNTNNITSSNKSLADSNKEAGGQQLQRCVCTWKNCRAYQKVFREVRHEVYDGCIKIKIVKGHPESLAYKECLDRTLGVQKQPEWKNDNKGSSYCKYFIAKHHFTEQHIRKYESNPKTYSFVKPFSLHGAKKYLFAVDVKETFTTTGNDDPNDALYLQCPNVTSDVVKAEYYRVLEAVKRERQQQQSNNNAGAGGVGGGGINSRVSSSPVENTTSIRGSNKNNNNDKTNKKPRMYEDDSKSVGTSDSNLEMLKVKETENKLLKAQLDAMKSQLTFLHDMVEKLQAQHFDNASVYSKNSRRKSTVKDTTKLRNNKSRGGTTSKTNNGRNSKKESAAIIGSNKFDRGQQQGNNANIPTGSVTSLRSGNTSSIPDEINFDDDDDTESRTLVSQWNENDYGSDDDNRTHMTTGTFQSRWKQQLNPTHEDEDDGSEEEQEDDDADDDHDDYLECISLGASTILSASRSVKTLPRELELDEDEDDSESHTSLEEEAFESRSVCSGYHRSPGSLNSSHQSFSTFGRQSQNGRKSSIVSTGYSKNTNSKGSSNERSNSIVSVSTASSTIETSDNVRGSITRRRSNASVSLASSQSGGNNNTNGVNSTSNTYEVTALEVTDPYGEKGTYTGSISKSTGMPHGHGRLEYDEAGRWYEGDWKHGRWTGFGVLSNGDGDYYEGGLKNDHKHGQGIMQFADGRTYEGRYINGQMVQGKMTYQDGSTYEGTWVEGMRHGRGRCVFADESIYEGEFKEGEFCGHGKMTWNDGGWYEGQWLNGEMHGHGREIRADRSLRHDGEWLRGQPVRQKKKI